MQIKHIARTDRKLRSTSNGNRRSVDWKSFDKAPRIYVSVEGETLIENLMNRKQRPHVAYRSIVKDEALSLLGLSSETHTLHWSQYAGCSCPCSPGFIVKSKKGTRFAHGVLPKADITVTIGEKAEKTSEPSETKSLSGNGTYAAERFAATSGEASLLSRMRAAGAI